MEKQYQLLTVKCLLQAPIGATILKIHYSYFKTSWLMLPM